MDRLAAIAEEHDPVVRAGERSVNTRNAAYELVLTKGYYQERIAIPMETVARWLEQNDRNGEAAIRRLISAAIDRLDERDYAVKDQGLWDWTGDRP